jgi:hypothetical protein
MLESKAAFGAAYASFAAVIGMLVYKIVVSGASGWLVALAP